MPKTNQHAGQFNLRGKKTALLNCKCCVVSDLREELEAKRIKKELKYLRSTAVVAELS